MSVSSVWNVEGRDVGETEKKATQHTTKSAIKDRMKDSVLGFCEYQMGYGDDHVVEGICLML